MYPLILLHPNIPKPLHGVVPRQILGNKWWQQTRQSAYKKMDYHCWACGIHKKQAEYHQWLEAHECYSIDYKIGRATYSGTAALCHACHNYIHSGRMRDMCKKGEYPEDKYLAILSRGEKILEKAIAPVYKAWEGFKKPYEEFTPHFRLYPDFPAPFKNLVWQGNKSADWERWHLIINGDRYERKFNTFEDWNEHYNG